MILAGDVGGTKTVLALVEKTAGGVRRVAMAEHPSRGAPTLEAIVRQFLAAHGSPAIETACLGVAGPVLDGRSTTTNLPWTLDARVLEREIPARRVLLLNDLEATAWGVLALPAADLATLQAGTARPGNAVVIAAGTGLGEALIVGEGAHRLVVATEGGHADFAPRTDREIALLQYLQRRFDHVSCERVLSGPGLFNIYGFVRETSGQPAPPALQARLEAGDPSAAVAEAALAGEDAACVEALDLFVSIYGAEAGNLALKALAVGGVYVAGGIGPKIRPKLESGAFTRAFRAKGRFASLLESIPIRLALDPHAPLIGAAHVAARMDYGV